MYSIAFRRLTSVHQSASYSYIQTIKYCHNVPQPTPEWMPSTESETEMKLKFSNLDPDEFGTLSKEPSDIDEILEEMPQELEDTEEIIVRDKEGKKQRRPMKFYYHSIKDLLKQKKVCGDSYFPYLLHQIPEIPCLSLFSDR